MQLPIGRVKAANAIMTKQPISTLVATTTPMMEPVYCASESKPSNTTAGCGAERGLSTKLDIHPLGSCRTLSFVHCLVDTSKQNLLSLMVSLRGPSFPPVVAKLRSTCSVSLAPCSSPPNQAENFSQFFRAWPFCQQKTCLFPTFIARVSCPFTSLTCSCHTGLGN